MRRAGERPAGLRVRGLIVVLWRAAFALARLWRSPRGTSSQGAARCSSVTAREAGDGRLGWTTEGGASLNRG